MMAELLNKNQRHWKLSHSGQAIKKQEHELIKIPGHSWYKDFIINNGLTRPFLMPWPRKPNTACYNRVH